MATLKVRHVPQYSHLAGLLVAHRGALHAGDDPGAVKDAEALACALEERGPTYIKLGQLLSGRADLLPPAYIEALGRLQDHAEPMPIEVVREVIEEELGARLSKVFPSFDEVPLGSASLAQVHRATTRDGRSVAVKVQRPGLRKQIVQDMEVIGELATTFDEHVPSAQRAGLNAMVEEFRRSLLAELDYRQEAANLRSLATWLEPYKHLFTPVPLEGLSTSRVLTMTLVEGRNVLSLSPLAALGTDGDHLADELFKAYLDQVLVHGVFHADPHPGNVMLTPDGRLALVDMGMVSRVTPSLQDVLLRLLVALSEGHPTEVAQALEKAGEKLPGFDHDRLVKDVAPAVAASGASLEELQIGRQLAELARISVDNGLRPAPELTMLGKTLLNLDDVARRLSPTYQPANAVRQHTVQLMRQRMLRAVTPSNLVSSGSFRASTWWSTISPG